MNFLIEPSGDTVLSSLTNDEDKEVAGKFVDQLITLGVLEPLKEEMKANCPLFCVEKHLDGDKRPLADMKRGGQNRCIGKDPVCLVKKETILSKLHRGGWTATADASKQFHNFPTRPEERKYLGMIHPITGEKFAYRGLPMGSASSPSIACRINNGALRMTRTDSELFLGNVQLNSWQTSLRHSTCDSRLGHGRTSMGPDSLPVALTFSIVDDYFIHGPTRKKTRDAFSAFMDYMLQLGFICQPWKTKPPAQCQVFCGMEWDTTDVPTLRIPEEKVSRALLYIDHLLLLNLRGKVSQLAAAVVGGLLQSLVDGTPARQGQTHLRNLYANIHHTSDLHGAPLYYTTFTLSESTTLDLKWWKTFLTLNLGCTSRAGHMHSVGATFGDGSGTGTGGTKEIFGHGQQSIIRQWMGTWIASVRVRDSNWKELRTLLHTLDKIHRNADGDRCWYQNGTVFYFTDNLVTYFVVLNGSSTSPELHELIARVKELEVMLGCRVEPVHIPGRLMTQQGADGLSRGLWMSPDCLIRSSIQEAAAVFKPVPYSQGLARWVLQLVELAPSTPFHWHSDASDWRWDTIHRHLSIWTPSPEVAHSALAHFMDIWVEEAHATSAIFIIPRVLQREWGHFNKHITEIKTVDPLSLPLQCRYKSLIPLVVLHCPCFVRVLPPVTPSTRMDEFTIPASVKRWHQAQVSHLRWL